MWEDYGGGIEWFIWGLWTEVEWGRNGGRGLAVFFGTIESDRFHLAKKYL